MPDTPKGSKRILLSTEMSAYTETEDISYDHVRKNLE